MADHCHIFSCLCYVSSRKNIRILASRFCVCVCGGGGGVKLRRHTQLGDELMF